MLMSDYKFDGIETWWPWLKSEEATFSDGTHITHALVPTKETNTMMYWLNLSVKIAVPIVIVGDTAVGKSFTIRQFLNELPKEKFIHSVLNLAANTKPQTVQEIVMAKLDRRRKGVFGPPVGKLVSFVEMKFTFYRWASSFTSENKSFLMGIDFIQKLT